MKERDNHINLNIMLFFILLALKLFGVISWSWWIITFPIWIPFVSMFIVGVWVFMLWIINNYK